MKGDYKRLLAAELLQYRAREIANDYKLNAKFRALLFSLGQVMEKSGCSRCVDEYMNWLAKHYNIKRGHGKVLSTQ